MSEKRTPSAASGAQVIWDRTYPVPVEKCWALWTTQAGLESWWPPVGFRSRFHLIEARENGKLRYEMVAESPEVQAFLRGRGMALSSTQQARFSEFRLHECVEIAIWMDFVPNVTPYENIIRVEFSQNRVNGKVRMVVSMPPAHSEEFTKICVATLVNEQLPTFGKQLG